MYIHGHCLKLLSATAMYRINYILKHLGLLAGMLAGLGLTYTITSIFAYLTVFYSAAFITYS